jgi:hypothetical protein
MKPTNLLIIGGAVVLGGLYLTNKSKKDKAEADARALAEANALAEAEAKAIADAKALADVKASNVKPVVVESKYFTKAEATKKALEVVTKWIALLDAIPKEFLTQENKNIINRRIFEEKAKQDKIDYDKALAEAKLKKLPNFTFKGTTYWTANEEDTRNGSFVGSVWKLNNPYGNYFVNTFKYSIDNLTDRTAILIQSNALFNLNQPATLGDYIKLIKGKQFSELYDILKVVFTEIPKSDVNRLVVMLPKYLMASSDDFDYFRTQYEKNPFTIEEQLYLKDINLEGLLSSSRNRENQWQQQMTQLAGEELERANVLSQAKQRVR